MQPQTPPLELYSSASFPNWLEAMGVTIAFSTYQAGRLYLLGLNEEGRLWAHERFFEKCQGVWTDGNAIWLSTAFQLHYLKNHLAPGEIHQPSGCDKSFLPLRCYTTGQLDIHDIGMTETGCPLFVNTAFNCISAPSDEYGFSVYWQPHFISAITPEDRCHLNGMAMENGLPRYVSAISRSDVKDGWRDRRADGGIIMDVASNEIVATGFSMPHSPRLYRDKLWVLNSGTGEFVSVDPTDGTITPICFCPGYARGLSFVDKYAVIGLSLPRDGKKVFDGLPLDAALAKKDTPPRCGLLVVDIETGQTCEWLRIEGVISELYDVGILPATRRARMVSLKKTEEIKSIFYRKPE